MRLSDTQFEVMMSNPNIKFEYADIDSKIAYIPPKGDVIYINVDLEGCPDDVLMAILYALASLYESKNSPWLETLSEESNRVSTIVEDCFVVNKYMKNLYPFVLLDEKVRWTHKNPEAVTRSVIFSSTEDLLEFVELSMTYGRPFVKPYSESDEEITSYGEIDLNQVMGESSLNSDRDKGERTSPEEKSEAKSAKGGDQPGFSSSPEHSYLGVKQRLLSECLTAFFSRILDRGKKFRLDSMKLYNRRCRQSDLMYSSISKKVTKTQDKLGILIDVSGSMDLDTISTLVNMLKDDLLLVFSSESLVLCWDTGESERFLISETPKRLRHGGGTYLAGGVDTLVREGCKTIVVYSDFCDSHDLTEACIKAKGMGIRVFYCNPDSLSKDHRDNEISLADDFIKLWNDTLVKMSSLGRP